MFMLIIHNKLLILQTKHIGLKDLQRQIAGRQHPAGHLHPPAALG